MVGDRVFNLSAGEFPQYPKREDSILVRSSRARSNTPNSLLRMSGGQSFKKSRFDFETVQDSQFVCGENSKIILSSAKVDSPRRPGTPKTSFTNKPPLPIKHSQTRSVAVRIDTQESHLDDSMSSPSSPMVGRKGLGSFQDQDRRISLDESHDTSRDIKRLQDSSVKSPIDWLQREPTPKIIDYTEHSSDGQAFGNPPSDIGPSSGKSIEQIKEEILFNESVPDGSMVKNQDPFGSPITMGYNRMQDTDGIEPVPRDSYGGNLSENFGVIHESNLEARSSDLGDSKATPDRPLRAKQLVKSIYLDQNSATLQDLQKDQLKNQIPG